MKKMKKVLALTLSASMALGMSMTGMAAEPEVSVDAPIYAYDITNVIVPATYVVAFNPNGLDVTKGGSTVNDQIVSKNYGIINKSSKDKVITVSFEVEDLNEGQITFTEDPADVNTAAANDYVINLTMVPANDSEVKVGSTPDSANKDTAAADLGDVTMTGATSSAQNLVAGTNEVDFLLEKAVYTGSIDLDNKTDNNVADAFTLTGLAADGAGITAFTFGGSMNPKADWTKLTKGIRITAVYDNENAPDGATAESGTGALFVNPNPTFKAGDEIGTIKYRKGSGTTALASIQKVEMENKGKVYDGYNANGNLWKKAIDEDGKITLQSQYMSYYLKSYPDDTLIEATVTYETVGGDTKTATVNVRLKEQEIIKSPVFTTGSGIGTISYTSGTGNDALGSITKIEMDNKGKVYDGYNANGNLWAAATDSNGLITLQSKFITYYTTSYASDATRPATVTYVTSGGETKTAIVDVKIR